MPEQVVPQHRADLAGRIRADGSPIPRPPPAMAPANQQPPAKPDTLRANQPDTAPADQQPPAKPDTLQATGQANPPVATTQAATRPASQQRLARADTAQASPPDTAPASPPDTAPANLAGTRQARWAAMVLARRRRLCHSASACRS